MLTEYFFWFAQPSSILNNYDWAAGYFFAGLTVLGVLVWMVSKFFVKHVIIKKLLNRYASAAFWLGLVGLIWFGFRYETVPIFSKRVFAGSILLIGLIWFGWIKSYLFFKFRKEKQEYDYLQVKNRYIK
jgi:uncharacterized membrane protein (DUF485 family)